MDPSISLIKLDLSVSYVIPRENKWTLASIDAGPLSFRNRRGICVEAASARDVMVKCIRDRRRALEIVFPPSLKDDNAKNKQLRVAVT